MKIQNGKDQKEIEISSGVYKIYGTGGVIGYTNNFLYNKESVGIGRKGTINRPFYFNEPFWTVDTLFWSKIKEKNFPKFIYYLFFTIDWNKLNQSTGVPSLTSHVIEHQKIVIPKLDEQKKIAMFFTIIDKKIDVINSKLSILKKYKEGLIKKLINSSNKEMKLSQLITVCEKTKLQSSYGKTSGKYKFFINSSDEITKWSDDYIFDGEYLILNTGGTAFTNYVNGKFSAMSDCLVVKTNSKYSITIYYWLKSVEKWIDAVGFQGTGLKHLDINWLLRQKVKIIEYDNKKLSNFNKELNSLIELNSLVLEKLKLLKNIFLNLMFI